MSDSVQAIAVGDRVAVTSHFRAAGDRLLRPSSGSRFPWHFSRCPSPPGRPHPNRLVAGASLVALITLAGCGAPAPKDYGGSWAPVNRFQSAPTEIPLSPAYTFYASPMDATLRTMLKRWATDNGLELSYQAGSDFTLYQPVAKLRTTDLQSATGELSSIYVQQGVSVTADNKRILVHSTGIAQPAPGSN